MVDRQLFSLLWFYLSEEFYTSCVDFRVCCFTWIHLSTSSTFTLVGGFPSSLVLVYNVVLPLPFLLQPSVKKTPHTENELMMRLLLLQGLNSAEEFLSVRNVGNGGKVVNLWHLLW